MELCRYPAPEKKRFYEIEAIEIPIVYNKYGDHDPNGLLYVLKKDAEHVRECAMQNFLQDIPTALRRGKTARHPRKCR